MYGFTKKSRREAKFEARGQKEQSCLIIMKYCHPQAKVRLAFQ